MFGSSLNICGDNKNVSKNSICSFSNNTHRNLDYSSTNFFSQERITYTLAVLDLVGNEISHGEAIGLSDKFRSKISQILQSDKYIYELDNINYTLFPVLIIMLLLKGS